jgi:hypothetical protein
MKYMDKLTDIAPPPGLTTRKEDIPKIDQPVKKADTAKIDTAKTVKPARKTETPAKAKSPLPARSAERIFQAGKRVGTGLVELDVEPDMKHRLTALMDGHRPVNFTVDGSRGTVTVMLKPVPRVVAPKPVPSTASDGSAEATTQDPAEAPATEPAATPDSAKPDAP